MASPYFPDAAIVAIDDDEINLVLIERALRSAGYDRITTTDDPAVVFAALERGELDLLISDLHMPYMDGLELTRRVRAALPDGVFLPIVVITADESERAERDVLSGGADDYIIKPIRRTRVLLRVGNLLRTRRLYLELQEQADLLEERVRQRTEELDAARVDLLERLSLAAEYRDDATARHTERVGALSAALAREVGLPEAEAQRIGQAAPLHDLGKIGVPDHILLKPGRLSDEEYRTIQKHVELGAGLLSQATSELMAMAEVIVQHHHERWDGSGYPAGLSGEAIPLPGRIVAIADVFDVLLSPRPYKHAWTLHEAIEEMRRQRGNWFDPNLLDAFLAMVEREPDVLQRTWRDDPPGSGSARTGSGERRERIATEPS